MHAHSCGSQKKVSRVREARSNEHAGSPKLKVAIQQAAAAKESVAKARTNFDTASERAKLVRKSHGTPHRRPPVFDLTTRNGARGNYRFVTTKAVSV
jgi:hypothetical protein